MKIRRYIPSDQAAVLKLFDWNTPQYFDETERAGLVHFLKSEIEDYFVVEDKGQIVGAGGINYEPQSKASVFSWDIIKPTEQGKGIGRTLTQHRIQHINIKPDIEKIIVRTSQHTDKFYEKMGFKLLRIKKDYWAEGFDLYEMEQPNRSL